MLYIRYCKLLGGEEICSHKYWVTY